MYLRDSDECEVLLRLIDDCDRLIEKQSIDGNAAFRIVSEAAKHHSDHPAEKRRRLAELKAEESVATLKVPEPVSVPVDAGAAF